MSSLRAIYRGAMRAAYDVLPERMRGDRADVLMLAIGLQESRFEHRRQINGPARGWWQFEQGGGVRGVLTHPASRLHAVNVCQFLGVPNTSVHVYRALEHDDVLAAAFARLLLWTDSRPLPALGDEADAWDYYIRNWRPGKPHPQTWDTLYQRALSFVTEQ